MHLMGWGASFKLKVCRKNLSKINSKKHSNKLFSLSSPNIKTQKVKLIADSGATDLFVTKHDSEIILGNLTKCEDFQVVLPNGDIISAVEEGTSTLSTDPVVQVTGYVFEDVDLKQSLLGLSPLTNEADCQITMDKNELVIMKMIRLSPASASKSMISYGHWRYADTTKIHKQT